MALSTPTTRKGKKPNIIIPSSSDESSSEDEIESSSPSTYLESNVSFSELTQTEREILDIITTKLIFAEGTKQSRIYLRQKCAALMDRIDLFKTKLEPIPSSIVSEQSIPHLPIDQLKPLNLS